MNFKTWQRDTKGIKRRSRKRGTKESSEIGEEGAGVEGEGEAGAGADAGTMDGVDSLLASALCDASDSIAHWKSLYAITDLIVL